MIKPVATQTPGAYRIPQADSNGTLDPGWLPFTDYDIDVVSDYGARGDGTTDDTTAIQNALTAASGASGKRVLFRAGTYKVTSTLTVSNTRGIELIGVGTGKTTIQPTSALAASSVIRFTDVRDSRISDMTIGGVASPNYIGAAIELKSSNGSEVSTANTIENLIIGSSFYGYLDGIKLTCAAGQDHNNDLHTLQNINFRNLTQYCVRIAHSNSLSSTIRNCQFGTTGTAVYADAGSCKIVDCWVGDGSAYDFQLGMDNTQTQNYNAFTIINTQSENHGKVLKVAADNVEVYMIGYTRQAGSLSTANMIELAGASNSLNMDNCRLYFGQLNNKLALSGSAARVSIANSRLAFTHITGGASGYLFLDSCYHDPGTVDISGLDSTCNFVYMRQIGGGFTGTVNTKAAGALVSNIPQVNASDEAWSIKSAVALLTTSGANAAGAILALYNAATKCFKFAANGMMYLIGPAANSQPGFYIQATSGGKFMARLAGGSGDLVQMISDGGISSISIGIAGNEMQITSSAVTVGASIPLKVGNGLRANNNNTARPAASSTYRGQIWYTEGGGGVADTAEICVKDAGGSYSWVTLI